MYSDVCFDVVLKHFRKTVNSLASQNNLESDFVFRWSNAHCAVISIRMKKIPLISYTIIPQFFYSINSDLMIIKTHRKQNCQLHSLVDKHLEFLARWNEMHKCA